MSWVVVMDFNDVANSIEKFSGATLTITICSHLNSMMTAYGLIDLGFQGPAFTWCNKRKGLT